MAGITVACSHCGAQLKLKDDSKVGRKAPCPKCKKPFIIKPIDDAGEDFDLDDDFDEPAAAPAPKSVSKGGKGKSPKKGTKSKSSGGGVPMPALIGGGVLVLLLGVGGLLWGLGVFGGGEPANPPAVADNSQPEATDPASMMEGPSDAASSEMPMEGEPAPSAEMPAEGTTTANPETPTGEPPVMATTGTETPGTTASNSPLANMAPPLDLLHPKSELIVHVNVARMLSTPLIQQGLALAAAQGGEDPLAGIQAETGFDLAKVQTVTFGISELAASQSAPAMSVEASGSGTGFDENGDAASSPAMSGPPGAMGGGMMPFGGPKKAPPFICIVKMSDDVDISTLKLLAESEMVTDGNVTYYRSPPVPDQAPMIASKIDDHRLAFGTEASLLPLLQQPQPWSPNVAQRFAQTDFDHHLTLVVDAASIPSADASPAATPPDLQQLEQLLRQQTTGLMLTLDVSDSVDLRVGAQANDTQGASGFHAELTRLWSLVPPQMENLPPLVPSGLKDVLTGLVNSAAVESKDTTTYLHLTATSDQLQSLVTEAQSAAGLLMAMAMTNGGGMSPFGSLPGMEPEPVALPLGEQVLIEGMEPVDATGLPEGMLAAGLLKWEIATDPQGMETIEPVVLVAIDSGTDQHIAAYRANEKIPERRRSAGTVTETTRDEEVADDPVTGILVSYYPSLPSTLQDTLPNFESQLLLRTCATPHDIEVADVLKLNGPIDDDVVRPLAMRVSNEEGVLKLMYRANTRVVVGVSKVVSAAELSGEAPVPGTAPTQPAGSPFGEGTAAPTDGFAGGAAAAEAGITRTKTDANGNVTVSFEGALPPDAVLQVVVYPDLKVSNVKFQFQGLPVPPKPESVEALRAAEGGVPSAIGNGLPGDGAFNN